MLLATPALFWDPLGFDLTNSWRDRTAKNKYKQVKQKQMYWLLIWLGFPLLILFTIGVYYLSPPEWTIIQKLSFCFTYFSIQFSSVAQLCPALCDPMDCSTPGFPVHYRFQELAQTHVHWVGDAIQPSHPLLSPSPPTFNLSQHQGLLHQLFSSQFFASGDQSIGVSASASVLPMNIQDWFPLGWTGWISMQSKF